MVLGDTLKEILDKLIKALLQLTVVTPSGTSSTPVNFASFEEIGNQLNDILSKKSNLE